MVGSNNTGSLNGLLVEIGRVFDCGCVGAIGDNYTISYPLNDTMTTIVVSEN